MPPSKLSLVPSLERQDRISSRIKLVTSMAHWIHKGLFPPIQEQDLRSVGLLALVRAADKFSGLPEETFHWKVMLSIRGAILDDVRHTISRREHFYGLAHTQQRKSVSGSSAAGVELQRALEGLPWRQQRILELRLEGFTQTEAGRYLSIGQRAAGRLEKLAIEALRARMRPVELRTAA